MNRLRDKDMKILGHNMFTSLRDECESFEEASWKIVRYLFDAFQVDDEPEFPLIRIFRTTKHDELPLDLRTNISLPNRDYLALMGTFGVEEAWCDRRQSSRKAILIGDEMSPMFKGVFRELGFSWTDTKHEATVTGKSVSSMGMIRYYYVEDASASNQVTDMDTFVEPYGIKSVVGFGTQFMSQSAYVLIAFSNKTISPRYAEDFMTVTPYVSTLLALFDERKKIWAE